MLSISPVVFARRNGEAAEERGRGKRRGIEVEGASRDEELVVGPSGGSLKRIEPLRGAGD